MATSDTAVTESSITLVKEFWENVFNGGNYDDVAAAIGPAYTFNGRPQTAADVIDFSKFLRSQLEGIHVNVDDIFGCGEHVAIRWTVTGTWAKDRSAYTGSGINMIRIVDGKAFSNWQQGPAGPGPFSG